MVSAVGLVVHPSKPVAKSVEALLAFVAGHPVRVLARESDRGRVPAAVEMVTEEQFVAQVGAVVSLGGDGTMLGAMRLMIPRPVPVLGVNHGNLGFLVEVSPAELPGALAQLAAGDFTIEPHPCLEVGTGPDVRYGFNDVVLGRTGRTGSISVDLTVNDLHYGYYKGDAVIVSTPTGSTAYNYAAGGPVLSPSSQAMVITPVAPMAGIGRPVVLGASERLRLTVAEESAPIAVDVDGTVAGELGRGEQLTAVMRPDAAQVMRLSASKHASRSRIKLSLLDLPLRRDQLLELIPPELRRQGPQISET
ncbi:NAD(+)/NADH kinase [Paractinoplanes ferrugineus]|uniref:NAD kinase n=1 Tax=Paractinoplanes ferrugineus TaxID=113564 RepID=A0A919MJR9_9ACTN|nr:NAD(+)/NADH kinase [Actinoplanes ferrugineus]GIE10442.1 NAD kinase [Actinoplanes ferrugineus]